MHRIPWSGHGTFRLRGHRILPASPLGLAGRAPRRPDTQGAIVTSHLPGLRRIEWGWENPGYVPCYRNCKPLVMQPLINLEMVHAETAAKAPAARTSLSCRGTSWRGRGPS